VKGVLARRHLLLWAWLRGTLPLLPFITGVCCHLSYALRKMKLESSMRQLKLLIKLAAGADERNQALKE